MINPELAEKNIAAGAEYFDRIMPGWEEKIDFEKLCIFSNKDCIAGQLYGSYGQAIRCNRALRDIDFRNSIGITCLYGGQERLWINEAYRRLMQNTPASN